YGVRGMRSLTCGPGSTKSSAVEPGALRRLREAARLLHAKARGIGSATAFSSYSILNTSNAR
ncbi:unnamed protein product, partial [Rangifer tarandus platyrhynchus]